MCIFDSVVSDSVTLILCELCVDKVNELLSV